MVIQTNRPLMPVLANSNKTPANAAYFAGNAQTGRCTPGNRYADWDWIIFDGPQQARFSGQVSQKSFTGGFPLPGLVCRRFRLKSSRLWPLRLGISARV